MVDLTFLRKFAKDDPKKMKRYISLYLDVAPKTFEEMQRNLTNGDWEQLRINAHSLKPYPRSRSLCLRRCWINLNERFRTSPAIE